jgi:1-acyl-sn-glycerol-3-phosphate acyltransferase
MRTLWTYTFGLIYALYSIFPLQKVKKAKKQGLSSEEFKKLAFEMPKKWARRTMAKTGSNVEVIGEEKFPEGAVLVVSNHQSNFDILAYLAHLTKPIAFISKIEVKKLPLVPTWMEFMHCVFIDRKDKRQSVKAFKQGIDYLKQGDSLIIFPEGTRTKSNQMLPFKSGSFRLATKAGIPIVPIAIDGTYKIMEANNNWIKPANVKITVCDPIMPEEYEKYNLDELAEICQSKILEVLQNNGK